MVNIKIPERKTSKQRRQPSQNKDHMFEEARLRDPHSPSVKKLITQTLSKLNQEKEENARNQIEKSKQNEERKRAFRQTNEDIRKRNAGRLRENTQQFAHKTAWGVDQRQFDHLQLTEKLNQIQELRSKVRTERRRVQLEGRARIGMELYKTPKCRKRSPEPLAVCRPSKRPKHSLIRYMQLKKQQTKIKRVTEKLAEMLKENEREKALYQLDLKQKSLGKRKKLKRKDSQQFLPFDKDEVLNPLLQQISEDADSVDFTDEPPEKLLSSDTLRTAASSRIQKWFRGLHKSEQGSSVLQPDLIRQFNTLLSAKQSEIDQLLAANEELAQAHCLAAESPCKELLPLEIPQHSESSDSLQHSPPILSAFQGNK